MYRKTQTEIFIQTLADLLDDERESQRVRRRLQHKERAERFVQAFWAKLDDGRRTSEWTVQGRKTEPEVARHVRNG